MYPVFRLHKTSTSHYKTNYKINPRRVCWPAGTMKHNLWFYVKIKFGLWTKYFLSTLSMDTKG